MDYLELGMLALRRGEPQEAVNIFHRAREMKQGAAAYIGLAKAFLALGDAPAARWACTKALDARPQNREAAKLLARIEALPADRPPQRQRQASFRVREGRFEVLRASWQPLFLKGINLGVGLPGYFPGEFAVKQDTYRRWFEQMAELGVNSLRTYTLHPPGFYEALAKFNDRSPRKLYLVQGIWAELPQNGDFNDPAYVGELQRDIRNCLNALYGNATLPERPGAASGAYRWDVSPYVCAYLFGREWEGCAVNLFNQRSHGATADFRGVFLQVSDGSPFERWAASMMDGIQAFENETYGVTRPVSIVNWPTLDPLVHPSESEHEQEARWQGQTQPPDICNENEDTVSFDTAKISSRRGPGFFATYHAYPYYPDFMNYDYLASDAPYGAYLRQLRDHHRGQAVLIAEFGVPSSRESAHWHRQGWHQGGHSEARQGDINGMMMKTIHQAGLAGGVLFSWFDEWFKKNWLISAFDAPADRSVCWFNAQNPEQNFGLLAAYPGYPGKAVSLTGSAGEWKDAALLAAKGPGRLLHRFGDGGDGSRQLRTLKVRHDEGFLYVLLETSAAVDFNAAHYCIGLSTAGGENGELLVPFGTGFRSAAGLTFLVHLAGRERSRILACHDYDKGLNAKRGFIRPGRSDQGQWVIMQNKTNMRRLSKDGKRVFPARHASLSALQFGSLDPSHRDHDSRADFYVRGTTIELRIPWGLINFSDPSSKRIVWIEREERSRATAGVGVLALSYKPAPGGPAAVRTGREHNAADVLPVDGPPVLYAWEEWTTPLYHFSLKESYHRYRKALAELPEDS
jgi:hypothetical protein